MKSGRVSPSHWFVIKDEPATRQVLGMRFGKRLTTRRISEPWCVFKGGFLFDRPDRRYATEEEAVSRARLAASHRGGTVCLAQNEDGSIRKCCMQLCAQSENDPFRRSVYDTLIHAFPDCQCVSQRIRRDDCLDV